MYQQVLTNFGLTAKEAEVYETLLKLGPATIQQILKGTAYKRGDLYNILIGLEGLKMVETKKMGKKTTYIPAHPAALQELVKEQEQELEQNKKILAQALPELQSLFNMISGKPGVRYYEGKDGIIKAYEELLNIRQPIDSIEDKGDMAQFLPEYFPKFIKKRVANNIFNRVVAPSSNQINTTSEKEMRESRTIPVEDFPFNLDIKICAATVLFVTLKNELAIAVRIDHPLIAENFRLIFKFFWQHANQRLPDKPRNPEMSSTVFNT